MSRMVVAVLLSCALLSTAHALPTPGVEQYFGPTTVNAISGNGGLSVGISKRGELVVLKWPSPSYFDHLNYRTQAPGPATLEEYDEHFGAAETWGSFAGLVIRTDAAETTSWLRDSDWQRSQRYLSSDVPIIVTEYENLPLGLSVVGTDLVKPEEDVFIRHFSIRRSETSTVRSAQFVYLANMAPCTSRKDFVPTECWAGDEREGFATVYGADLGAFVSFKPDLRDRSRLPANEAIAAAAFLENVDAVFPPAPLEGPYELLSTQDVYWTIGADRSPSRRMLLRDPGRTAAMPDLVQNETSVETGPALLGLIYNFEEQQEVSIVFAAARSGSESMRLFREAAGTAMEEHIKETRRWWEDWIGRAALPAMEGLHPEPPGDARKASRNFAAGAATDDPRILHVVKQALISLKIATDRESGAMVASITNQPPYGEDWPRDGAFFNFMLDLAGYPEMVEKHNLFYAEVMRKEEGQDRFGTNRAPAGSFAMNYYADGRPGGTFDFEIDEVGFGLWTLWAHTPFLPESKRKPYLKKVYPAIQLAADLLTECRDATNGLQCPAEEDDNPGNFQTLHGASAVLAGLKGAVQAGWIMGEEAGRLSAWENRVAELEAAIVSQFYDEDRGDFGGGTGAGAWLIWPAEFLSFEDPRMQTHSDYVFNEMLPFFRREIDGGAYFGKATAALSRLWKNDPERRAKLEPIILALLKDVPTADTGHYGEVFVVRDVDGGGTKEFEMHVAQPHVWEAALSYLTARFFYGPDFVVPADEESTSCGCHSFGYSHSSNGTQALLLMLVLTIFLVVRRQDGILCAVTICAFRVAKAAFRHSGLDPESRFPGPRIGVRGDEMIRPWEKRKLSPRLV